MQNFNKIDLQESVDLGKIFRLLMMKSKLIVLIVGLGALIAFAQFYFTEKTYRVKSLVQIYVVNNIREDALDPFINSAATSDINNIANLYLSRTNVIELIDNLGLHITSNSSNFDDQNLISASKNTGFENINSFKFEITLEEQGFKFLDGNEEMYEYYVPFLYNGVEFTLKKPLNDTVKDLEITVLKPSNLYQKYRSSFQIKPLVDTRRGIFNSTSGLIEITFDTPSPRRGKNILDYANQLFIDKNIRSETEKARSALGFINDRVFSIETRLSEIKEEIQVFKQQNNTVDVNSDVQRNIQNITSIENKLNEIDIEIANATNNFTSSNPLFVEMLNRREELNRQRTILLDQIDSLPAVQQDFFDLYQKLEKAEQTYRDLDQKKLELSIMEASTLGNIRVVDKAYVSQIVSPTLSSVYLILFISFFFAIALALIRGVFFTPISNPAELPDNGVDNQILGVLPLANEKTSEDNERLTQSLESLIVNINQTIKKEDNKASTILLTSPTAENGKSYIARALSKQIEKINKKVLLFDVDWKRGDQHKTFNVEKISQSELININADNINKYKVEGNLYLIPKVSNLDSSFRLVNSIEFDNLYNFLQKEFDYIVIDTAPLLSVSDTAMLLSMSDMNILVCRHAKTKVNEVKQTIRIADQVGINFDGLIYNCYEKPSSYYGYYGYYGNYTYQYYANKYLYESYDYKKNE